MSNKRVRSSFPPNGLTHADVVIFVVDSILKLSNIDSSRLDPLNKLNFTILLLDEDENTKDEAVRANAEHRLGAPVSLNQVLRVRKFIGSLFPSGKVTEEDVRRIRRMFIGRFTCD
jgi:hypothetical protein